MPNDAKNSTIMPIIIIKVNSATTKFVMKTNPGIDENNKYSMVMCLFVQQKKDTLRWSTVGNYF
jgi:hypothetical protein